VYSNECGRFIYHRALTKLKQSLARGFFHGFTGLVTDPVAGAIDDGAAGFAKGFVTGTLGVLFKPGAGKPTLLVRVRSHLDSILHSNSSYINNSQQCSVSSDTQCWAHTKVFELYTQLPQKARSYSQDRSKDPRLGERFRTMKRRSNWCLKGSKQRAGSCKDVLSCEASMDKLLITRGPKVFGFIERYSL